MNKEELINNYKERVQNLEDYIKEIKNDIKLIYKEAKEDGIRKQDLKDE